MSIITGVILYDIVGALVAIFTILYFYCKWAFTFWRDKGVPYMEPTLFWGNFRPPHRKIVTIGDELMQLYKKAKGKGWKHVGLYNMTSPFYVPLELELVKCILTKDFNNFYERGVYYNEEKEPISAHLFAIGGKKWRNLRTKFTPTFTSGKMRMMFQTIADCGTQLEKYLVEHLDHHEPFDIKFILGNFSTDIIGSCAFGIECNSFKEPNNLFRKMGNRFFNRTRFENLKIIFALNFVKLARFLGITIVGREISDFFSKVVKDTVNYREKNNVQRKDFMQLLIEIKNTPVEQDHIGDGTSLTLDEMTAQSFVFFLAGFETSSTTMTFALYELSKNQDIQQRVRDEINTVLKKHDGKVTYDALNEMHYLSQVIDETLRMYPPVPLITRVCVEDYVVPGMNVELKKGQRVFIPIRAIHYDEEYYPSPEVFDPERFSDENKHDRNPYAHIPFGEGPRICIGMRFGIMQSKVGLISILKNFNVTLNKKTKQPLKLDVYSFVPQADGGIWLNLEKIV